MEIALEVSDLSLQIGRQVIFRDLAFCLPRGQCLYVLGASGSGKSLLLKICAGLFLADRGKVTLEGIDLASASQEEIQRLRARVGFVFQNSALISNMAVYDNVALPLRYHRGGSEGEVRARVEEKMAFFGVDRSFDRSLPSQLSLEMRRRAALARAFALDPEILFLDQPTSGLESETALELAGRIGDYRRKSGATLLEVSGEWLAPDSYADQVGLLENGRIAAQGTEEEMRGYREKARI